MGARRAASVWAWAWCWIFGAGIANAQQAGAPPRAGEESADAGDVTANARKLYAQGRQLYALGEYDRAIESFKAAYALAKAPELLFDVAQTYRRKAGPDDCARALDFYASYLEVERDAKLRARVRPLVAEMNACARKTPTAAPPDPAVTDAAASPTRPMTGVAAGPAHAAPSQSEPTEAGREKRGATVATSQSAVWPVVVASTGAFAAIVGGVLWGSAHVSYTSLEHTGCAPDCELDRVRGIRTREQVGGALLIGGAVLAAAGIVWWALRPSTHERGVAVRAPGTTRGFSLGEHF